MDLKGKKLIDTDETTARKIFRDALARMHKCVPPLHLADKAWIPTGKLDANGLMIHKPEFHSCGTENWNSQQMSFVCGSKVKHEFSTACFYEGNANLITKKEVAAGRQEVRMHSPLIESTSLHSSPSLLG